MLGGKFLGEITIRFGLELVHRYADDPPAAAVRATAGSLHHPGIATGANRESRLREQLADLHGLRIFRIALAAFRSAKDRNDWFVSHNFENAEPYFGQLHT